jgi:hypothetical protein
MGGSSSSSSSSHSLSLVGAAVVSVETVGSVDAGIVTSTGGVGAAG